MPADGIVAVQTVSGGNNVAKIKIIITPGQRFGRLTAIGCADPASDGCATCRLGFGGIRSGNLAFRMRSDKTLLTNIGTR